MLLLLMLIVQFCLYRRLVGQIFIHELLVETHHLTQRLLIRVYLRHPQQFLDNLVLQAPGTLHTTKYRLQQIHL